MYIYKITNNKNNKVYIGQTARDIKYRFYAFKSPSSKTPLSSDIKKYGIDCFSSEIIDFAENQNQLDHKERFYISFHRSNENDFGYNLDSGGKAGFKRSKITIKNLSALRLGKTISTKGKKNPNKSRVFSEETRRKISEKMFGKKRSEEVKKAIRLSHLGRPKSEEHREKIGAAMKINAKKWTIFSKVIRDDGVIFEDISDAVSSIGCKRKHFVQSLRTGGKVKGHKYQLLKETEGGK